MSSENLQHLVSMVLYIGVVIGIGVYYAKRASESSANYLIGGRSMGPWIVAMGAEASDMSGWLLMGLPGVAYFFGLADAFWTALGLAIGTYLNWLFVAKRLRQYSAVANDSITIPDFLSNRFKEKGKVLMLVAAAFIIVFFTVYTASCFVTTGKLFNSMFGIGYRSMMVVGALFVVAYTFIGGFLAESASDFMQGCIMILALSLVLVFGVAAAGGIGKVAENVRDFPGFLEFFGMATPDLANGVQKVAAGKPLFAATTPYGLLVIISTMSWGLGYFGMPQVLTKFMSIRKTGEIALSRRIAMVWVVISMGAAVAIGIIGRALDPALLLTQAKAETIFIELSRSFFPPLLAGVVMAGILAATISSSDSYLLIAASAFSKSIYQHVVKKDASDKAVLLMSRLCLCAIAVVAMVIALDENSVIFKVVSFAWAGFGATFGPVMLFSLFWKRTTHAGAVAGMLAGGGMVFFWKLVIRPLGGVWGIYELFPAFVVSCAVIVVASLLSKVPSKEIQDEFEKARKFEC